MALRELASAVLFFGALAQQPQLQQAATAALTELAAQGYRIPTEDAPLRVFPALTGGDLSGRHAGGWRPGSIYLRADPAGDLDASVYLRHELFHEVSHRSCAGRLPGWAEEAAAMSFSGELVPLASAPSPSESLLQALRSRIRDGASLSQADRELLGRLIVRDGWPREPCAVSSKLAGLLGMPFDEPGSSAHLLMSLQSGRVLESAGDLKTAYPPGSLLKLPYAASLRQADPVALGRELAASDTERLMRRQDQFDRDRYRLLLSPIKGAVIGRDAAAEPQKAVPRAYLGERDAGGRFAIQANLFELAWVMRGALLSRPGYFAGLMQNGVSPDSTLASQSESDRHTFRQLHAMAKTGTVSDEHGNLLAGHLLVVWPAEHPVFLALFRQRGVSGAAVLPRAAASLRLWRQAHPDRYANVRVRLLGLTPRFSWEVLEDCPGLSHQGSRISLCGEFRIVSTARGSRSERRVSGTLTEAPQGGPVLLETDVDTYADAVLDAEAQALKGSAREAMRAVIVWNGSHGSHRHADPPSLCDTSHCMVFLGAPSSESPVRHHGSTDQRLLRLLDRLATAATLDWLPFATGGDERWEHRVSADELALRLGETQVLDIHRERRKDGKLFVHLLYSGNEDVVACEVFRNALKLPSCPDTIDHLAAESAWRFRGVGAGHGQGLSIARVKALAEGGWTAEDILNDAYEPNRR